MVTSALAPTGDVQIPLGALGRNALTGLAREPQALR